MPDKQSAITRRLIRDGLEPPKGARFADFPPALQAAVNAYDQARCAAYGHAYGGKSRPMSEANKASIAPMIAAAVSAYLAARARSAA